jgi:hypothetical protein
MLREDFTTDLMDADASWLWSTTNTARQKTTDGKCRFTTPSGGPSHRVGAAQSSDLGFSDSLRDPTPERRTWFFPTAVFIGLASFRDSRILR